MTLETDINRLSGRIDALGEVGRTEDGALTRLTLTKEDKVGRDLVVRWMKNLGLAVKVDKIGNIFGIREGEKDLPPVMTGSHIDTVIGGGALDGAYGVLAGLEAIETLNDAGIKTKHPICVAVFTNEEGVRFTPDMMGSLVHAGGLPLEQALEATDRAGKPLSEALKECGYAGDMEAGEITPSAFVELHIEQGPVLEAEGFGIGIVENLTGISWQEVTIEGAANHAGTTPMNLRKDACFAAARIVTFLNQLAEKLGPGQRATVGQINLTPNVINVVPGKAALTVDLRNPDNEALKQAENELKAFLEGLEEEGLGVKTRQLVRFDPVAFNAGVAGTIETVAERLGLSHRRMTSGAGHDAQMMARICPAAMIFVPSRGGISHNGKEHTGAQHLFAGANVLLHTLLELAE